MFEALLEAGADVNVASDSSRSLEMRADVNVVRPDVTSALQLTIVSGNARILNCMPKMIECAESAEISYVRCLSLVFLEPNNIFR